MMSAKPRWLLAIPDAISQLEQLDRSLLTRRRPSGPSSPATTLPRTKLLQLKKYRRRAAFRVEEERRERLFTELRQARLTGIRFKVPAESWVSGS